MNVTNATISDGMQYMNLTNDNRDDVYMSLSNNDDDDVRYVNLLSITNNGVRYMNASNPMALHDDAESNDKYQGKSGQLVSVAMYVVTFQFLVSSILHVVCLVLNYIHISYWAEVVPLYMGKHPTNTNSS